MPSAYIYRWDLIPSSMHLLLSGLQLTLEIAGLALGLSLTLGLVVALARMSTFRPLSWLAYGYTQVFRALSLYIYILWLYFGIATLTSINMSPIAAGVAALTLLNSAYMSEIYRSALSAIEVGQKEAALSLGLSRIRTFVMIVLPQGLRIAVPSLMNQFVDIVKDSSVVALIGTLDLMGQTIQLVAYYHAPFEFYTVTAAMYVAVVAILSVAATGVERRLSRHL